jgi:hypothetical protein
VVRYRASLIKDIAQQSPLEYIIGPSDVPSLAWLRDLGTQRKCIEHLLSASEGLGPISLDPGQQTDGTYKQRASIGMRLGACPGIRNWAKMKDGLDEAVARLRSAVSALAIIFLLHLHFASVILVELVTRRVDLHVPIGFCNPFQRDSARETRTATELMRCSDGYKLFWLMLIDYSTMSDHVQPILAGKQVNTKAKFMMMVCTAIDFLAQTQGTPLNPSVGLQDDTERRLRHKNMSSGNSSNPTAKWTAQELDLPVIKNIRSGET